MKTNKLLAPLSFILLFVQPLKNMSQENEITEYYYISVDFYSVGQGTDHKAYDELFEFIGQTRKKNTVVIPFEQIKWGKEGEKTVYIDIRGLAIKERQKFLQYLYTLFRDRNKMAIVRVNLCYEPTRKYLVLGISMFGQLEARENELLEYVKKWEKRSRFKINSGSMINETAIPEDQDRRIELNLSGLESGQVNEIVTKAQKIMEIQSLKNK